MHSKYGGGPLAGLEYQSFLEQLSWREGGMTQRAPAQRLTDFVEGRASSTLPEGSYFPGSDGLTSARVDAGEIALRLREGFRDFGRKMKGYLTGEALVAAVESRTSSPVRISRDPEKLNADRYRRIIPCR